LARPIYSWSLTALPVTPTSLPTTIASSHFFSLSMVDSY
jgi:hypothetical protein